MVSSGNGSGVKTRIARFWRIASDTFMVTFFAEQKLIPKGAREPSLYGAQDYGGREKFGVMRREDLRTINPECGV
jgi:hypothetical protein